MFTSEIPPKKCLRCTFLLACHAKWLVLIKGYTQVQAAVILNLPQGTVHHVIRGHRFQGAFPIPMA